MGSPLPRAASYTHLSDTKKPADWGGIICGYNSEEVVLNHVDVAYAGATPTESSECDWSSDVCSSDLISLRNSGVIEDGKCNHPKKSLPSQVPFSRACLLYTSKDVIVAVTDAKKGAARTCADKEGYKSFIKIGRASCRERV